VKMLRNMFGHSNRVRVLDCYNFQSPRAARCMTRRTLAFPARLYLTGRWASLVLLEQRIHHELGQRQHGDDIADHLSSAIQELEDTLEQVRARLVHEWTDVICELYCSGPQRPKNTAIWVDLRRCCLLQVFP